MSELPERVNLPTSIITELPFKWRIAVIALVAALLIFATMGVVLLPPGPTNSLLITLLESAIFAVLVCLLLLGVAVLRRSAQYDEIHCAATRYRQESQQLASEVQRLGAEITEYRHCLDSINALLAPVLNHLGLTAQIWGVTVKEGDVVLVLRALTSSSPTNGQTVLVIDYGGNLMGLFRVDTVCGANSLATKVYTWPAGSNWWAWMRACAERRESPDTATFAVILVEGDNEKWN